MSENNDNFFPTKKQQDFFEPIIISYDELDADNHQIDFADFGKSA